MISIYALVAILLDVTRASNIEIVGVTRPFENRKASDNEDDEFFELQLKQYIFQTQYS